MDVHIRTAGFKVTEEISAFIERKMAKLDRLAEHVTEANLELKKETLRNGGELTTAQLTLQTGRHILRAEERAPEATKAIDAAVDKLVRQVRKYNGKRADRRKRGVATGAVPRLGEHLAALQDFAQLDSTGLDGDDSEDAENRLVRIKRFSMKPMNVDEAIDQMELIGHDFFLFQNADEDQLNVLYRRRDGSFGLLAPTSA
jgi:putative sigma-54 modulation protein